MRFGVIYTNRQGKEVAHATALSGRAHCQEYLLQEYLLRCQEIRERRQIDALAALDLELGFDSSLLGGLARFLRKMFGIYDRAARAAASL
jgi:predicted MarR family transcription regulator